MLRNLLLNTPRIFAQLLAILVFWIAWAFAGNWLPRPANGWVVEGHAMLLAALAFILWRRAQAMPDSKRSAVRYFAAGYAAWAVADALWAIHYFVANQKSRSATGIAVTMLCAVSFALNSLGLRKSLGCSLRTFCDRRITAAAGAMATATLAAMLFHPYLFDRNQMSSFRLFDASEVTAIMASYVLLIMAIMVLLSSRALSWSIYGAGTMCWVLGDCAIRIGKILHDQIDADVFSVMCSFGIYASLVAMFAHKEWPSIERVDFSSLFITYKFGSIIIIFICLLAFLATELHDLHIIRLVTLSCCLASFGSILLSHAIVRRIQEVSSLLGTILNEDEFKAARTRAGLPRELRDYYDYALSSVVAERKNREIQRQLDERHRALRKVAHNILSPVAALDSLRGELADLPESFRVVMKTAIDDIRDTANALSYAGAAVHQPTTPKLRRTSLLTAIDECISQKRLQFRSRRHLTIEFVKDPATYGIFADVDEAELRSVISNLVNNSVDAVADGGAIIVTLSVAHGNAIVSVQDNGCGIPPHFMDKLGVEGATLGKPRGSGFGLYHAQGCAASWEGRLDVDSTVGRGTRVSLVLPCKAPPPWFVPQLRVGSETRVVIVDDNAAIHSVWARRFAERMPSQQIQRFFSGREFFTEYQRQRECYPLKSTLYLIDMDLGDAEQDGISLIQAAAIGSASVLVTSHHADHSLQKRCARVCLGMIPKSVAGLIPIIDQAAAPAERLVRYDAVLIDDDAVFRGLWESRAQRDKKRIRTFRSVADFQQNNAEICRTTPIYVDSELGQDNPGEMDAKLITYQMGFQQVFVASAHKQASFSDLPWLAGAVGKLPPWSVAKSREGA